MLNTRTMKDLLDAERDYLGDNVSSFFDEALFTFGADLREKYCDSAVVLMSLPKVYEKYGEERDLQLSMKELLFEAEKTAFLKSLLDKLSEDGYNYYVPEAIEECVEEHYPSFDDIEDFIDSDCVTILSPLLNGVCFDLIGWLFDEDFSRRFVLNNPIYNLNYKIDFLKGDN